MRTLAAIALICTATAPQAHPHIFIDAGLTAIVDDKGALQAIKVTWDVAGAPMLAGHSLSLKPYDPTYYTSYDVTMNVTVQGLEGCTVARNLPDLDAGMKQLQDALSKLGRDQDAIEEGFPEVGEAFATDVEITCAPR